MDFNHIGRCDNLVAKMRNLNFLSKPFALTSETVGIILGLSLFTLTYLLCFHLIEEDAYIYFRLAENIANGHGYVFNIGGERVEAGSSPLWIALLSSLVWLGIPALAASKLMGLTFGYVTLILLVKHAVRFSCNKWLLFAVCIALPFSIPLTYWSSAGLETPLYASCLLLYAYCVVTPSFYALLISTTLMLFVRPEGMIVVLSVSLVALVLNTTPRRMLVKTAFGAASIYGLYIIFRLYYFNDLQISPFYAKAPSSNLSLSRLWHFIRNYNLLFFPLALVLMPLARTFLLGRGRLILIYLTCILTTSAFACSNPDIKLYHRYYAPLIPFFLLFALLVFSGVLARSSSNRLNKVYTLIFIIAILLSGLVFRIAPLGKKIQENPLIGAAKIYMEESYSISKNVKKTISQHSIREIDMPKLQPYLDVSTLYRNYQAQVGFLIKDTAPYGAKIVYDQMGQTAYFSGSDKQYVDLLGLATKSAGYYIFSKKLEGSTAYQYYDRVLRAVIDISTRTLDLSSATSFVDKIYADRPELILVNGFVVAVLPDSLSAYVARDRRLKDVYDKCIVFANLVTVYKRKDIRLSLPKEQYYTHSLETFDNTERCFVDGKVGRL